MISVQKLVKSYGHTKALKGIDLQIQQGQIVGFLGPNGAGKTTAMKILSGYMSADSGVVKVGDYDCCSQSLDVKRIIGYLPENNPLYQDMLVLDYLLYIASIYDIPKADQASRIKATARQCGIADKLNKTIAELSKGYKQRVGIASVLLHNPQVLILDEPTVGLDPNQIVEIRNLIKELGKDKTIILCSHILSEVEATCERILIINEGKIIAEGSPAQIRKQAKRKSLLKVVVEGKQAAIEKVLNDIDEVTGIHSAKELEGGAHEFELEVKDSPELRKSIIRNLIKHKCEVLEIYLMETTLEDAFSALTG